MRDGRHLATHRGPRLAIYVCLVVAVSGWAMPGAAGMQAVNETAVTFPVLSDVSAKRFEKYRKGDPRDRRAMVAAHGASSQAPDTALLLLAAADGYRSVREAALQELEQLGEPLGRLLARALAGSEGDQDKLVDTGDPRIASALAFALNDWDPDRHGVAWRVLQRLPDNHVLEPLTVALRHGTDTARVAAAYLLGKYPSAPVAGALIAAASDRFYKVRLAVMYALKDRRDDGVVDTLIRGTRDPNAEVRAAAIYGLAAKRDSRIVPTLTAAMSDENLKVRIAATWTVGAFADDASLDALIAGLDSKDPDLAVASARSLAAIGNRRAVEPLIAVVRDASRPSDVRAAALETLGSLRDARAVDLLIDLMAHRLPALRSSAFTAAANFADPRLIGAAIASAGSPDEETRAMARTYLLESRDPAARVTLGMLDGTLDASMMPSLSQDGELLSTLASALASPRREVRRAAARGLAQFPEPVVIAGLTELAGGWSLGDRAVASRALLEACGVSCLVASVFRNSLEPASLVYTGIVLAILAILFGSIGGRKIRQTIAERVFGWELRGQLP